MTYQEITTPSTGTKTVPQSCGDDPFGLDDIPGFLRRTPGSIPEDGVFAQSYTTALEIISKTRREG